MAPSLATSFAEPSIYKGYGAQSAVVRWVVRARPRGAGRVRSDRPGPLRRGGPAPCRLTSPARPPPRRTSLPDSATARRARSLVRQAQALTAPERRAMIDRDAPLPVTRQCQLLQVTRSTVYYEPVPVSDGTLAVMRALDEIHLAYPFLGSRKLVSELVKRGLLVNRKRVQRLMGVMGIEAIYPKPRTSKPGAGRAQGLPLPPERRGDHQGEPGVGGRRDLHSDGRRLRLPRRHHGRVIASRRTRAAASWRGDCPTPRTVASVSTRSPRRWRPTGSRRSSTPIRAAPSPARRSPACSRRAASPSAWTAPTKVGGRWIDNVFIERFWRSLKYEEVYLHAYDDLRDARRRIERYLEYYNHGRSHQSLDGLTPEQVYHHDSAGALVAVAHRSAAVTSRPCS